MSKLYLPDIQDNALQFSANFTQDGFIYELLAVYGISNASIARMRHSKEPYMLNNKVHFMPTDGDLEDAIEELKKSPKTKRKKSRFLVATDFERMRAVDTKTDELLDIAMEDFFEDYGFFLPWTGREKVQVYEEIEADQKAAQKMAKLFEIIRLDNPNKELEDIDALNHFFSRLIFCYYAEDTGIFENKGAFTNYIEHYTDYDGSNTAEALRDIFNTLNTQGRSSTINTLKVFPYVNGGLFEQDYKVPIFSSRARRMLIECGKINWAKINPDIFGAMFQGVMDDDIRHELGAHYTSIPNIMKVINPLFMDDLREELKQACEYKQKSKKIEGLQKLHDRIGSIKIFDPACGSGNFLIMAYKELRYLEMQIFEAVHDVTGAGQELGAFSTIEVSQFYGIELNPFAVELAKLSMWLAEHQVNMEFQRKFTTPIPSIPLRDSAHIVVGNACRVDWEDVCPKNEDDEIYILGNPPYLGARVQNSFQKEDVKSAFHDNKIHKDADYISCWFILASTYIKGHSARFSFVTTNSICQGDHVGVLWPIIFSQDLEIFFTYEGFKWSNNAKQKAGVTCVIIGIRNPIKQAKYIYKGKIRQQASNINGYLSDSKNIIIHKRPEPITPRPKMVMGSQARDGGNLILSTQAKKEIEEDYPESKIFFRKLIGSEEFLKGNERWCLWIIDDLKERAESIPPIKKRIDSVYEFRIDSKAKTTNGYSSIPHKFAQRAHKETGALLIPAVSSELREYIPFGFVNNDVIVSNRAFVIYDHSEYLFSIISSKLHMIWVKAVAGRLETRINYSSGICYNNFPIPSLSHIQKNELSECYFNIEEARDMHPGKTLADLYAPDKMPQNLRDAHHELDMAVDRIYRKEPFKNDDERLAHLFKLYEKMTKGKLNE